MLVKVKKHFFDGTLHEPGEVFEYEGSSLPSCLEAVEAFDLDEKPAPAAKRHSNRKHEPASDQEVI